MERLRRLKGVIKFHLILNFIVVVFITGASYYHIPLRGFKDTAIYFLHLCALQTTLAGLFYFLSLNKWLFRIIFTALFLLYCCFSFWAYSQDVSITESLIQSIFETRADIAFDVITWPYIGFFLAAVLAVVLVLRKLNKTNTRAGFAFFVVPALLCISLYFVIEKKRPGTLVNRLPYNVVKGIKQYYEKPKLVLNTDIGPVITQTDSIKLVFILGETVRADHLGLNGYERNTTPLLAKEHGLISVKGLYTDNTYTATSVPQILTDQLLGEDVGRKLTSVYSVASAGGVGTYWLGNQSLENSFAPIVHTNDEIVLIDKYKSEFSFAKKRDEALLEPMDSILGLGNKQLITLHMIGSHWYYENRYTEKHRKFVPTTDSKYLPANTSEELINSYDNTIVYMDYFLKEVINRLKQEEIPTAMVYISDHGELLGEDGKWLHAQDGDALKNPAYIIWFSEKFKTRFPEKAQLYTSEVDNPMTTDVIYPTVLDLLGLIRINN